MGMSEELKEMMQADIETTVEDWSATLTYKGAAAGRAVAHTLQVLAGLVAMVGHWYWSFDHAAIRCC